MSVERSEEETKDIGPDDTPGVVRPPSLIERPRQLGGYEVLEELGRGGMAIVYKARNEQGREVAIKVLQAAGGLSVEDRLRFQREAHAAARLRSKNVVRVLDWGSEGDHAYLVMDLIDGDSLRTRLEQGPVSSREAARLVEILARTLAFAHRRGVVHRDVKPGNILIDRRGEPLLTDFGLAKPLGSGNDLTSTGQILGTPPYMSPEQAAGSNRQVGPAVDVYGLGATLFSLLTGRPPFLGSPLEVIRAVAHDEPPAPSELVPEVETSLDAITLTCLAKGPDDRYPSCEALAADLRRYLEGLPVVATLPSGEDRVTRSIRSDASGWIVRHPSQFLGGFDPTYADHAERLLERFASMLRTISVSIVDDGHIDRAETALIRREWERLKAYTDAFVAGCEEGVFAPFDEEQG